MDTTVEMVHCDDVENVIKMIYETLLDIKEGKLFPILNKNKKSLSFI